ncbi:GNAT family N-acetyltransferase [candidate division KSB1 bacterium]|nr:GNAT family N-acetyltransferase [candidate division KSB1 bacterium]
MIFDIRSFHPSDLVDLYRICLLTGDSGKDASELYTHPELLGQIYAAPYAVCEPDLCFVLTADGKPSGYILGTRDTERFNQRCQVDWFPVLQQRYAKPAADDASPDARLIAMIHSGFKRDPDLADYPAHLHIDLLPEAQGQGMGRRLMQTFFSRLADLGVPAVHLGVGKKNESAIAFYNHIGFVRLKEEPHALLFGFELKNYSPGDK